MWEEDEGEKAGQYRVQFIRPLTSARQGLIFFLVFLEVITRVQEQSLWRGRGLSCAVLFIQTYGK